MLLELEHRDSNDTCHSQVRHQILCQLDNHAKTVLSGHVLMTAHRSKITVIGVVTASVQY